MVRGSINNIALHFAEGETSCAGAHELNIKAKKIFRVIVNFDKSQSLFFFGTNRTKGLICDPMLSIKTNAGNREIPFADIRDVIWAGIPQNN